jgi:hypothetical protein
MYHDNYDKKENAALKRGLHCTLRSRSGGGLQLAMGSGRRTTSMLLLDTTKLKILTLKLTKVDGS